MADGWKNNGGHSTAGRAGRPKKVVEEQAKKLKQLIEEKQQDEFFDEPEQTLE